MPVTEARKLVFHDSARRPHLVEQLWVEIPGTGVSVIVAAQPVDVDPALLPACPTRPV